MKKYYALMLVCAVFCASLFCGGGGGGGTTTTTTTTSTGTDINSTKTISGTISNWSSWSSKSSASYLKVVISNDDTYVTDLSSTKFTIDSSGNFSVTLPDSVSSTYLSALSTLASNANWSGSASDTSVEASFVADYSFDLYIYNSSGTAIGILYYAYKNDSSYPNAEVSAVYVSGDVTVSGTMTKSGKTETVDATFKSGWNYFIKAESSSTTRTITASTTLPSTVTSGTSTLTMSWFASDFD